MVGNGAKVLLKKWGRSLKFMCKTYILNKQIRFFLSLHDLSTVFSDFFYKFLITGVPF